MEITIENYEEEREKLIKENSNLSAVILRENEKKVDEYLSLLKKELYESFDGNIPYGIPVLSDKKLTKSRLYSFCRDLPKGADLHVHDVTLLPVKELIRLLCLYDGFMINKNTDVLRQIPENGVLTTDYIRFSDAIKNGYYTEEDIIKSWTVSGYDEESGSVWDYFENLFEKTEAISFDLAFLRLYYDRAFRYYCENNITHVEIHIMLTESIEDSAEYIKIIREAYYGVKKDYPFFTVRMIGAGVKADSKNIELTKKCFLNASYVQEMIKDESDPENVTNFIIGFDLVNEEDGNLPLKAFAPMLLKVKKLYPEMNFYIHGGESINSGNENLIDAYLLGVSRVGHGLNLYRYPDLHLKYAKKEICLEVCPISNQRLGYTKDLRTHPITEYLRSGVFVALCSDDPSFMENETLTDDFFAGTVCWDLSLKDIKQLCINSLLYSGLDEKTKYKSLKNYNEKWNEFITKTVESLE